MSKSKATPEDPRGLIADSFEIEELSVEGARAIFLDWAMMDAPSDPKLSLQILYDRYEDQHPDHPMIKILREGLDGASGKGRRGGRSGRRV